MIKDPNSYTKKCEIFDKKAKKISRFPHIFLAKKIYLKNQPMRILQPLFLCRRLKKRSLFCTTGSLQSHAQFTRYIKEGVLLELGANMIKGSKPVEREKIFDDVINM
ncbi:hypothetical protein BpHYR1_049443 [Brachionus plicatilis]|uniref:Uncharacterized protein n=1 Tax=Brachionus plicatilis TaxID=10195 RepID=A0A3M7P2V6_BRAPC|nr:hypothetical protein BpHYR1_049443 [Brachionus plicatilis]